MGNLEDDPVGEQVNLLISADLLMEAAQETRSPSGERRNDPITPHFTSIGKVRQ